MADTTVQLNEFHTATALSAENRGPGTYTIKTAIRPYGLISTLFVHSIDPGATLKINYYEKTTGSELGERYELTGHCLVDANFTVPYTNKIHITALNNTVYLEAVVSGGSAYFGVTQSSAESNILSAYREDATFGIAGLSLNNSLKVAVSERASEVRGRRPVLIPMPRTTLSATPEVFYTVTSGYKLYITSFLITVINSSDLEGEFEARDSSSLVSSFLIPERIAGQRPATVTEAMSNILEPLVFSTNLTIAQIVGEMQVAGFISGYEEPIEQSLTLSSSSLASPCTTSSSSSSSDSSSSSSGTLLAEGYQYAAVPINDTTWTPLISTGAIEDFVAITIQNESSSLVRLRHDDSAGFSGMRLAAGGEKSYNEVTSGFEVYAKSAEGSFNLNVEALIMPGISSSSGAVAASRLISDLSFTVNASSYGDGLLATFAEFSSMTLKIDILDTVDNRRSFLTIVASKQSDNTISEQVYGRIDDDIIFDAGLEVESGNVVLRLTNNDSNMLQVNIIKISS